MEVEAWSCKRHKAIQAARAAASGFSFRDVVVKLEPQAKTQRTDHVVEAVSVLGAAAVVEPTVAVDPTMVVEPIARTSATATASAVTRAVGNTVFNTMIAVDPGLRNAAIALYVRGQGFKHIELLDVKLENQKKAHGQTVDMPALRRALDGFMARVVATGSSKAETVALIENQFMTKEFQGGTRKVDNAFEFVLGTVAVHKSVCAKDKFVTLLHHHAPRQGRRILKKISVAYIDAWLKTKDGKNEMPAELLEVYLAHAKRDDLADAMMMVLAHVGKPKVPTPYVYRRPVGPRSKKARAEASNV